MRTVITLFGAAGALALGAAAVAGFESHAAAPPATVAGSDAAAVDVDVALVVAVDISYSMDPDEQALQREGYITGFNSPEFLGALQQGTYGRIAVTYFEWAGTSDQRVVVPWTLVDGARSARAFTDAIAAAPYRRAYRTSISGALQFAVPLFQGSGVRGLRRVIDVSGDGANNQGDPVEIVRDEVLERGFVINGLPILLKRPTSGMDIENLDVYYEDCVTGGPGSFVIPIRERDQFRDATRSKLVQEIAGSDGAARVMPAAGTPRVSCTIGERMWRERWDFR